MPAPKTARITRRTPIEPRPATLVRVGDTLTTRKGDVLVVEKVYTRNGKTTMVFADTTASIPAGASVLAFNTTS